MREQDIKYLSNYIKVTEKLQKKIETHIRRYGLRPQDDGTIICAYYSDWEDFCSDWCDDIGYTRTGAKKLLHGGRGEFMILPDEQGIIRFII